MYRMREDHAQVKRVELHCHTGMSRMVYRFLQEDPVSVPQGARRRLRHDGLEDCLL